MDIIAINWNSGLITRPSFTMRIIKVNTTPSYRIHIGKNIIFDLESFIKKLGVGNYASIITNKTVYSLYRKTLTKIFPRNKNVTFSFQVLPDTERIKSFPYLLKIIDAVGNLDFTKRVFFVCWGGGVIGDLGGFASSIFKRGAPCIQIPTTLLAQIDSSIGGKTAIDLKCGKNLIGSFWQPRLVLSDTFFLKTLPLSQLKEGLAEAVKYGLIQDEDLFDFIEQNYRDLLKRNEDKLSYLIYQCVKIKKYIVENDERETKGLRTILNFGHTIGHGIEASSKYRISHGNAIALGMLAALTISKKEGILKKSEVITRVTALLRRIGLPTTISADKEKIIQAVKKDKKFYKGSARMVLLRKIGQVTVKEGITMAHIKKGIDSISK